MDGEILREYIKQNFGDSTHEFSRHVFPWHGEGEMPDEIRRGRYRVVPYMTMRLKQDSFKQKQVDQLNQYFFMVSQHKITEKQKEGKSEEEIATIALQKADTWESIKKRHEQKDETPMDLVNKLIECERSKAVYEYRIEQLEKKVKTLETQLAKK